MSWGAGVHQSTRPPRLHIPEASLRTCFESCLIRGVTVCIQGLSNKASEFELLTPLPGGIKPAPCAQNLLCLGYMSSGSQTPKKRRSLRHVMGERHTRRRVRDNVISMLFNKPPISQNAQNWKRSFLEGEDAVGSRNTPRHTAPCELGRGERWSRGRPGGAAHFTSEGVLELRAEGVRNG